MLPKYISNKFMSWVFWTDVPSNDNDVNARQQLMPKLIRPLKYF